VMTLEDRTYLLKAANFMFPELKLAESDVESSWAGLRPLIQQEGKSPSEISRRDEIFVSPSGLISIAGGKLTGYRKMAETVVDKVAELLGQEGSSPRFGKSETKTIPMSGGDLGGSAGFEPFVQKKTAEGVHFGFTKEESAFLAQRYGSNTDRLFALAQSTAEWAASHKLPLVLAVQLRYSLEAEMTVKPTDFFIRRTGDLFFRIGYVKQWSGPVIAAMADRLAWSGEQQAAYAAELAEKLAEAVEPLRT